MSRVLILSPASVVEPIAPAHQRPACYMTQEKGLLCPVFLCSIAAAICPPSLYPIATAICSAFGCSASSQLRSVLLCSTQSQQRSVLLSVALLHRSGVLFFFALLCFAFACLSSQYVCQICCYSLSHSVGRAVSDNLAKLGGSHGERGSGKRGHSVTSGLLASCHRCPNPTKRRQQLQQPSRCSLRHVE